MATVSFKDKEYEIADTLAEALFSTEGSARNRTITAKVSDATYVSLCKLAAERSVTLSTLVNDTLEKEIGNG